MHRLALGLVLALAACAEPPKQNRASLFVRDLQDITTWDAQRGGRGQDIVEYFLVTERTETVPALIAALTDPTPTRIDDRIHRIPTVGDVAFHLLMSIFAMAPAEFDPEGVWVGKDPINNPIWNVHVDDDAVRRRLQGRFLGLARDRGWLEPK